MNKRKELFKYMERFDDSDLPDGAWQAKLEESVISFNEINGTDFYPYDSFLEYCLNNSI